MLYEVITAGKAGFRIAFGYAAILGTRPGGYFLAS